MKSFVNWKFAVVFLCIAGGLVYITHSFWISLGIMLLLFVIDNFIQSWQYRHDHKKQDNEETYK